MDRLNLGESVDTITINGRTRKIVLHMVRPIADLNPRTLIGKTVTLDGRDVIVKGVETYAVIDPTNMPFGVEVEER